MTELKHVPRPILGPCAVKRIRADTAPNSRRYGQRQCGGRIFRRNGPAQARSCNLRPYKQRMERMAEHKKISPEDVAHMAALSRLSVSREEQALFARQFGDILRYMDVLAQVDTENVKPLYSPAQHASAGREDQAANRRTRQEVLANAPEQDGEYFIVPRIV